ncbi:MAG: thrombospondin type 3 repeat-containing protein [Kiritimatiellia bacterium]
MSFTNSLPILAVAPGFEPAILSGLASTTTPGGVPLRRGVVRETNGITPVRKWFGVSPTALAGTSVPGEYDPVNWVLTTFPPPEGLTGPQLDDYVADRRLSRQALAFTLIAAADVPTDLAEIAARLAAAPPSIAQEDIGVVQVEYVSALGTMEILVHAPPEVDYLGVYETLNLMNPFPWIPLGTVPHTVDPMAWSYPPSGSLRYVILANHCIDSDLDGILDALEKLVLGSKADQWDSDGDGISDFDEVYRYGSNPNQGSTGGISDQIIHGLGIANPDMSKIVSGSADLRFKTWRVERSKNGWEGLSDPSTRFLRRELSWTYPAYIQTGLVHSELDPDDSKLSQTTNVTEPTSTTPLTLQTRTTESIMYASECRLDNGLGEQTGYHVVDNLFAKRPLAWVPISYNHELKLGHAYTDDMLRAWSGSDLGLLESQAQAIQPDWGQRVRLQRPRLLNPATSMLEPEAPDVPCRGNHSRRIDAGPAPPYSIFGRGHGELFQNGNPAIAAQATVAPESIPRIPPSHRPFWKSPASRRPRPVPKAKSPASPPGRSSQTRHPWRNPWNSRFPKGQRRERWR